MKTPEPHMPHKLGANRHDPARREHHAKHPSAESRDVREDRSTRKSKLVTNVPNPPTAVAATGRQLLARERSRRSALLPAEQVTAPVQRRAVSLRFRHDAANAVFVAGTFNNWAPDRDPLQRSMSGEWDIQLELEPGRYEYLFVADGCWLPDPNSQDWVANPFGGHNSVLLA